jgi:hypothetical protein
MSVKEGEMASQASTRRHATAQTRKTPAISLVRDYALGWVLLALFLAAWGAQWYVGWMDFVAEARQQGEVAHVWGQDGYIWRFLSATMENWQSEFLQLLTFVVLTSFLIFRRSHESKDSDEELKRMVEELAADVRELRNAAR